MDTLHDDRQLGWDALAGQDPGHVVLLGDSIYMDYGWPPGRGEPNGSPKQLPLADFSARLHARYRAQYAVPAFRRAIANRQVHAIWDDHDFAWDNSRGDGPEAADRVSDEQRRISREHFQRWQDTLDQQPADYPTDPAPAGSVPPDRGSIARTLQPAPGVLLHLTDGRSFRQPRGGSLLGLAQRQALDLAFQDADALHIVAAGSSLEEEWAHYTDLDWLRGWSQRRRILVITGDIHKPAIRSDGRLHELVASSMAQGPGFAFLPPYFKKQQVFGLLEFDDAEVAVTLFHKGRPKHQARIDRHSWTLRAA
jgi:alkaline phosphatase D